MPFDLFCNYGLIKCIELALFGLLFIAFFIVSMINFRDRDGNLVTWKRVKIPKLYVAIGLLLVLLSGGIVIEMKTLNRDEVKFDKPIKISSDDVARLSEKIDSLGMALNSKIDSLIAARNTPDQ